MNDKSSGAKQSDESAPEISVRQLMIDHHAAVYAYAFRLTGQQADAEDVAQQTFLMAQRNLHQLRQPENPVPWLLAIARSCWFKSRRRQRPVDAAAVELDVNQIPGDLPAGGDIDGERLQMALDDLAEEFRLPLVMYFFEELSYKEIAAELEIPIGTVMSRLARAKKHLRKALSPDEDFTAANSGDKQIHSTTSAESKVTSA